MLKVWNTENSSINLGRGKKERKVTVPNLSAGTATLDSQQLSFSSTHFLPQ